MVYKNNYHSTFTCFSFLRSLCPPTYYFLEGSGTSNQDLIPKWQALTDKIEQLRKQQKHAESSLAFQFVEGTLVQAIRNGDWILLDEINLATPETLECLSGLLESRCGSVVLLERG